MEVRPAPYWEVVLPCLQLGYRKGKNGGRWLGKWESNENGHERYQTKLGFADDEVLSKTRAVLGYKEAKSKLIEWYNQLKEKQKNKEPIISKQIPDKSNYTVGQALDDYIAHKIKVKAGGKSIMESIRRINSIKTEFGSTLIQDLKSSDIETWMASFVSTPPRKRGEPYSVKHKKASTLQSNNDPAKAQINLPFSTDERIIRGRKATANRHLSDLKAALNLAFLKSGDKRLIDSDREWRIVKAFPGCTNAREAVLETVEQIDFINKCPLDFRPLVFVALLTGARYGELISARVRDFKFQDATLFVDGKTGPRLAPLTDEALAVLFNITKSRKQDEYIFIRSNGEPWKSSDQQNPMNETKILCDFKEITFHGLRHTCITAWAKAGIDLAVIADAVGNSVAIIEKHYKKFRPDWIRTMINKKAPLLGISSKEIENAHSHREIKNIESLNPDITLNFDLSTLHPSHYVTGKPATKTQLFRPSDDELRRLVWMKPTSILKKELNVSDTTISNWCKDSNITKPGRGYWQKLASEHE